MKTTIDIPEPLYKKAKIYAVERGTTMRRMVLEALEHAIEAGPEPEPASFAIRRRLLPEYKAALKSGAHSTAPDSTAMISEDRSSREDSLL